MSNAAPQVNNNGNSNSQPLEISQDSATNNANLPVYMKTATVGYLALLLSMVINADSTQNLIAQGMMTLSEAISNETQSFTQAWMLVMNNPTADAPLLASLYKNYPNGGQPTGPGSPYYQLSDLGKEQYDAKCNTSNNNPAVSMDTTTFNLHNTMYQQATTFFGGLSSGLNDTTNNMTNQVSLDYQQIQMNTLAIQQTLVSAL